MLLKRYHTYCMDFTSRGARVAGGLMGIYLFLTVLYHFYLSDASRGSIFGWVLDIILPLGLSVAMILLLCVFRLNAPGVYGILGAVFCVLFAMSTFPEGNFLRILLGVFWYLICASVLIITSGGMLPEIPLATCFLMAAIFVRVLCFDMGRLVSLQWVPECGLLSGMLSVAILPFAFRKVKMK